MLSWQFTQCRRGNIAVATGVLATPVILGVAMALDIGNMSRVKSDTQSALDAAGMAIAVKVPSGVSDAELEAIGRDHFLAQLNTLTTFDGQEPTFRYLGLTSDAKGVQHVLAEVDYHYDYLLAHAFDEETDNALAGQDFHLRTRISVRQGDTACVYALNRTAPRGIEAGGGTSITMDGCVIASNSSADDAIYVGGSATLQADCLQSSGGIEATGGLTTDCPANRENAWPLPDPFASLPEPVPPILYSNPKKKDTSVQPGRYRNLTLNGTKTLEPGLYYIEGDLSIKGTISGDGVTFFMADGGVTVNGDASMSLSAPQTGTYAGMLFMASRTNTSAHAFNGNGTTELNGYLYFREGDLTYSGNNGTSSTCLRIVADTVKMSGSSVLKSDCTAELGGREARVSGPLHFTR